MAQWQYTIDVKEIHAAYRETEDVEALKASMALECRALAKRTTLSDRVSLLRIARAYEAAHDIDQCDVALDDLYNWGDYNHKCWIGTF